MNDYDYGIMAYGSMSGGPGGPVSGSLRSPLHWPPPTSPMHSYGGFGGSRTPLHGFGLSSSISGEPRLSMSQFEFGADGELVLYSANGNVLPTSAQKPAARAENINASIREGLELAKEQLGFTGMDVSALEQKMQQVSQKLAGDVAPLLHLPLDQIDSLTPLTGNEVALARMSKKEPGVKQKTLTDGGRCRSKSIKLEGPVQEPQKKSSLVPQKKRGDLVDATPEVRFQKIQALYSELQRMQEVEYQLKVSIKHRDNQIASHAKDNNSLWSMAAHVGAAIQMALDEETRQATNQEPVVVAKTPVRQKRRRSSMGAQDKENQPAAKVLKTPTMTNVDGQQLLELEELFNSPGTSELFAACDMFMSPFGFAPLSTGQGMCPINVPEIGTISYMQHAKTPAKLAFPALPMSFSPLPLGNFNGHTTCTFTVDDPLSNGQDGINMDKEQSFSFQL